MNWNIDFLVVLYCVSNSPSFTDDLLEKSLIFWSIAARHVGPLGTWGLVGRLWSVFPRHFHSPGACVLSALALPSWALLVTPLPPPPPIGLSPRPQVWPQPHLPTRHPCFSPVASSLLGNIPISCPSPSGRAFSDLLLGKGRGGPPRAFFPFPRT